jgi:hypothetical protein
MYHVGARLRVGAFMLGVFGLVALPSLTGALRDAYERPTDPFGHMALASMRGERMLLCAKFDEMSVRCDPGNLQPTLDEAYIPAPSISWSRMLRLIRDMLIGGLAAPSLATAAWFGLWLFLRAIASDRVVRGPRPMEFRALDETRRNRLQADGNLRVRSTDIC